MMLDEDEMLATLVNDSDIANALDALFVAKEFSDDVWDTINEKVLEMTRQRLKAEK